MVFENIDLEIMGQAGKLASRKLVTLTTGQKDAALFAIANEIEAQKAQILAQNNLDIKDGRAKGLSEAVIDRLLLTEDRVNKLASNTRKVAVLPDPVGEEMDGRVLPNGIRLSRRRTPIGVLGVIYEARPNVTIDIATLCLKTGNAVILRGGSETLRSNIVLVKVIQTALKQVGVPVEAVQYISNPDRELVTELLRLHKYIDMIIPRGGAGLHKLCREQSSIPVITGGLGVCHLFVDESADLVKSVNVIENAKVQRPSVCNALDTLLVHRSVAASLLPMVAQRLSKHGVELRAAGDAHSLLQELNAANLVEADIEDFDKEWLALILGIKIVDNLDQAIAHIQDHSTYHSDGILTNNLNHATRFVNEIDSCAVFVNASTRFNDGGEFGLGAEVAVSTQKLHARGPMGLEALTTYKWVVLGDMHIRS
jgi:glutamate-5-semialdehyde dehydrogenase